MGRVDGSSGRILSVNVKTDNANWQDDLRVVFYSAPPSEFTSDNNTWPGTKYADSVIGMVDVSFFEADGSESGAGAFGFGVLVHPIDFNCEADSKKIYFQMFLSKSAPVPTSGQKFTISVGISCN